MITLSDEEIFVNGPIGRNGPIYNREHVKEFILQIKEDLEIDYGKSKQNKDFMLGLHHAIEIINNRAGKKLI